MSIPPPAAIQRELTDIRELLGALLADYRWASEIAYGGPLPTEGLVPPSLREPAPPGPDRDSGTSAQSDPVGATAVGGLQERARFFSRRAARKVRHALKDLEEAKAFLEDVPPPQDLTVFDQEATVRPDELSALKDAQRRRQGRDEGWGSG